MFTDQRGHSFWEGGPNRCREQTRRLQLDMDEVAHKLLIEDQFDWCSVCVLERGRRGGSGPTSIQRVTRDTKTHWSVPNPKYHIFTWERRSTWNTMHRVTNIITFNKPLTSVWPLLMYRCINTCSVLFGCLGPFVCGFQDWDCLRGSVS